MNYLSQLRHQLENNQEYLYPEHSQRRYCYANKQQAEATAETLHRKIIQETDISFEWRKENPNFDPKQWCLDNNFPYKSEWHSWDNYQIVWAIKDVIWMNMDDELLDNFRRSRYIYHPKHIDTWCNDNSVEYDPNLDNGDNYNKLLDYLHLPENIELLSKFWKDGTGNFAFVKEEIVLRKTYIEIGKELKDRPEDSKLLAVSKEDEEAAYKLLIEILESKQTNKQSKFQAREILQVFTWEDIPF